jgi:hypothetical protein
MPSDREEKRMSDLDDAVYIIAIRSGAPKDGTEVRAALKAVSDLVPEGDCIVYAVAHPYRELGSAQHQALVDLGFDWHDANQIVTVVSAAREAVDA